MSVIKNENNVLQNNIEEVKRLGTFLGKTPSDRLARDISEKCQFQNMYVDKMYPGDIRKKIFKGDFTMYRKGRRNIYHYEYYIYIRKVTDVGRLSY